MMLTVSTFPIVSCALLPHVILLQAMSALTLLLWRFEPRAFAVVVMPASQFVLLSLQRL
ncbi:hypothetical protein M3J09_004711 [Ascochyta lentis]